MRSRRPLTAMSWAIATVLFPAIQAAGAAHVGEEPRRPNILFAFADDWGRHASVYATVDGAGTPADVVRTPTFDRLAREGVLFPNAFVSAPSCTPCRSALLSGQHFWRTDRGAILRGAVWNPEIPSFPLLLHDAGYHIGKSYKVWSPGTPVDAPFGEQKFAYEQAGRRFANFSQNAARLIQQGMDPQRAKETLYREVVDNFDAFLADRDSQQPFCYWFGPTNVHRKWTKGSGKNLWGIDPDSLRGKLPPFLPDVPEVREDFADYLGEAQAFDAALGKLLDRLRETGEFDDTLIVVSGDHGPPGFLRGKCNLYDFGAAVPLVVRWGNAPGGRVVDDLVSLTDLAPTFLEAAGIEVPRAMTGRSLIEILESDRAGMVDLRRDAVFIGRERHVEQARADFSPYPQRAIRTRDHLLVINFRPDRWPMGDPYRLDGDDPPTAEQLEQDTRVTLPDEDASPTKAWMVLHRNDPRWRRHYQWAFAKRPREELYVLADDPHQIDDVAADPRHAATLKKLRDRLLAELRATGDPRLIDDGKYFETPPLAGPLR